MSATLLDADALDRLRELDPTGTSRLMERVLRAFHSSASRLAQQFREARASGDMQGIRDVAMRERAATWRAFATSSTP